MEIKINTAGEKDVLWGSGRMSSGPGLGAADSIVLSNLAANALKVANLVTGGALPASDFFPVVSSSAWLNQN